MMLLNKKMEDYGIVITKEIAYDLIETKNKSLKDNNLIEFNNEVLPNIIEEFYSSPYISKIDYEDTLNKLVDLFYSYRVAYGTFMSDEIILKAMRYKFDQGGIPSLLSEDEENLIHNNIRHKRPWDYIENSYEGVEFYE